MIKLEETIKKRNILNPIENSQEMFKDIIRTQASIATDEYFYVKFFIGVITGIGLTILSLLLGFDKVI